MEKPERTTTLNKLRAEARRIRPRSKVLMVLLALAAAGYLATLKHGVEQDHQSLAQTKAKQAEHREEANAEITKLVQAKFGGASQNKQQQALVGRVGDAIATRSDANKSKLAIKFYLLAEPDHINIYGLSTGDIYITTALLNRMQTEGQLASVLSHAVAHAMVADGLSAVTGAHSPQPLWQHTAAQERAADALTVKLMSQVGYDPNAFKGMLNVMADAYRAGADVGFFTTHPNTEDRLKGIDAAIAAIYPNGLPEQMSR